MLKEGYHAYTAKNNIEYTTLMRNNPNDNWLSRSVRDDASTLYRQQEWRFYPRA